MIIYSLKFNGWFANIIIIIWHINLCIGPIWWNWVMHKHAFSWKNVISATTRFVWTLIDSHVLKKSGFEDGIQFVGQVPIQKCVCVWLVSMHAVMSMQWFMQISASACSRWKCCWPIVWSIRPNTEVATRLWTCNRKRYVTLTVVNWLKSKALAL